jgi:two-component sensor histidine kinase
MQVIAALVDQLHGELEIRRDVGTEFRILFPQRTS